MTLTFVALGFERSSDALLREEPLPHLSIALMRDIFALGSDDPVVGAQFEVRDANLQRLAEITGTRLDLAAADWFVEAREA